MDMTERSKKILLALIPGELCVILAVLMFIRASNNNDSTSLYIAIGAMVVGSLISGFGVFKILKDQ
jgi:RsiW-degrading membrane proteinase PrsW (M82 family)